MAGLMDQSLGLRKGAWTEEEDLLLRKCIEMFGDGKWHQIPHRAGLNRCRKSCRLRWLNYLKPDINRGKFKEDEVDLMIRFHKLLGNRWSLIAGRLPGRTANSVKNYWNTHLRKKFFSQHEDGNDKAKKKAKVKAIRPRPRTVSKNLQWLRAKNNTTVITDNINPVENLCKPIATKPKQLQLNQVMWIENMLLGNDCHVLKSSTCSSISKNGYEGTSGPSERDLMGDIWGDNSCWSDIFLDVDLLDLFNDEKKSNYINDAETLPV